MTCTHSRTDGRYDNNRYVHIISYSNSSNIRTELYNIHGAEKSGCYPKAAYQHQVFPVDSAKLHCSGHGPPYLVLLGLGCGWPCRQGARASKETSAVHDCQRNAYDMEQLRVLQMWRLMRGAKGILVHLQHWSVRAHARYALTPMRLQTYEEVTSTKHRLTLNRMKQRPVSKRAHKAFGVPRQEEGTPGTAHIFQVPTSSIAPCQEVL